MKIPTPGSQIKVTLRYSMGPAMVPPQPDYIEFQGRVLEPFKWLTDREFCMEGEPGVPVRVINASNIVDLKLISGSTEKIKTSVETWTVTGSKGNKYTVSRWPSGWSCTCPGFQFRKSCKHTAKSTVAQT